MHHPPDESAPVTTKIPAPILREVGSIITRFAFVDWYLTEIARKLLGIGPKEGRIAVREPRTEDRLQIIVDLLALQKIAVKTDFATLRKWLESAGRDRDNIAHGIWLRARNPRRLILQYTKGNWPAHPQLGKISRKLRPAGFTVDAKDCRAVAQLIAAIANTISQLDQEVSAALAASPRKSPGPSHKAGRRRARSATAPQAPRLPFPE